MTEIQNQVLITVTFYFDDGENSLLRLNKKYVVQKWHDEAELRNLLDEIAAEMNHLSGYGIFSIMVSVDKLKFAIDYRNTFVPYKVEPEIHPNYYWFNDSLRFPVGEYYGGGKLWLEIPRFHRTIESPLYEIGDQLFKIKMVALKKKKQRGSRYWLRFDHNDPFLISFAQKINDEVLVPHTKTLYKAIQYADVKTYLKQRISYWYLPKSQTTLHKIKKNREREEKHQKVEGRKQKQFEKEGIVFKDKKQKKKALQVYIIQMVGDRLEGMVYKIGISHTPRKRLQTLNTSSPFELKLIHKFVATPAKEAETKLHERYAAYRMNGEWFQLPLKDVGELKKIVEYSNGEFIEEEDS